jgi:hypothetical protein
MDFYCRNIEVLMKHNPHIKDVKFLLEQIEDRDLIKNVITENENTYFKFNEKFYLLHSKNCYNEAEILIRQINFKKDNIIVLFGIGNVDCLKLLFQNISDETKIVIFEPNVFVLRYILENHDLTELFKSDKFVLIFGDNNIVTQSIIMYFGLGWNNMALNIQVISLPNYYLYNKYKINIIKEITTRIDTSLKTLGTSLEDMLNGFNNNYLNIDSFLVSNTLKEIRGQFEGYPAIVVASGPSLDKNINYLKNAKGKALIIACDASLNICLENGIKPDAIASIERDEPTYNYYYKGKTIDKDIVLLGPGLLWPDIYSEFQGKKIMMGKVPDGIERWWTSKFDDVEYLNMGFSSANVALAAARESGCNPIILIGQDLAYTDDKKHSAKTHTEYEGENNSDESDGTLVEDIYGNQVRTDAVYNLFRYWIEYQIKTDPKLNVIDSTEGGALINGSIIMPLKDSIDKYCIKELDKHLYDCLEDKVFDPEIAREKYTDIIEDADKQIDKIVEIQMKAYGHYSKMIKYLDINWQEKSEKELVKFLKKMQNGDKIIHFIYNNEDTVSFYKQIIKQTIIYVKKIGNEITGENVKRNLQLQLNLMYMINNSSSIIIDEYKKLKEYISNKKNMLDNERMVSNNE